MSRVVERDLEEIEAGEFVDIVDALEMEEAYDEPRL